MIIDIVAYRSLTTPTVQWVRYRASCLLHGGLLSLSAATHQAQRHRPAQC